MSTAENKATTTTTTEKLQEKIDLYTFLDTKRLTRAERSYYEKHYKSFNDEPKTSAEWGKIIKFIS